MLKLVQIIHQNRLTIILLFCFIGYTAVSQTKDNQINQTKSPNSNVQVGNGNVSEKIDNRKYYKNESKSYNENNSFTGPLIMGNNPFVIINNTTPNKDSIKYVIELKRKEIRNSLANYMIDGKELEIMCSKDTNHAVLLSKIDTWTNNVMKYLQSTLDDGYAVQFLLVETNDVISNLTYHSNKRVGHLYNYVRVRIAKLDQFITSLY